MEMNSREITGLTYEAARHLVNYSEVCKDWSDEKKNSFLRQLNAEVVKRQQLLSSLTLKSISELTESLPFLVANYQRGYKWTATQVRNLLDDVQSFVPDTHSSFYCLQPLVVSFREDGQCWELIDGQQRLTTIYLILSYLRLPAFKLRYQTRHSCTDFLNSLPSREITRSYKWKDFIRVHGKAVDNVDNFHFFQAWKTIDDWFTENSGKREDWADKLLHQTKVIWYNARARDNELATHVFMRINSGKIALTNAELVKALFLKQAGSQESDFRRAEIAREWDYFEQELQNDEFWYFLTGSRSESTPNRIELLFDIRAQRTSATSDDPFYTFNHFARLSNLNDEWDEIKKLFLRLQDWFDHDQTYHLLGFLVAANIKSVSELARDGKAYTKTDFIELLTGYIRKHFSRVDLEGLRYGVDNKTIQHLLLLFNVLKCDAASRYGNRFPFDRYLKERWSLEHIHAQHSQKLDDEASAKAFYGTLKPLLLKAEQEAFDNMHAKAELKVLIESLEALNSEPNKRSETAKRLIANLRSGSFAYFGDNIAEAEVDGIDNLALLDRDVNSALNNAIFPEKRKMIRDFDRKGRFIPAGTRDVFMKYYSDNIEQMSVWSKADRAGYLRSLETMLHPYLLKAQG